MLEFLLPTKISRALNAYPFRLIFEIRLRDGKPAYINEGGDYHTLKDENGSDIYLDYGECERILARATEFSLYAVNNQIVKGFLTVKEGVRIGVCGEVVTDNGVVKTELYKDKQTHLNNAGYRIWAEALEPYLAEYIN